MARISPSTEDIFIEILGCRRARAARAALSTISSFRRRAVRDRQAEDYCIYAIFLDFMLLGLRDFIIAGSLLHEAFDATSRRRVLAAPQICQATATISPLQLSPRCRWRHFR